MEGPADVVVTNANGSDTLAGGFTYVAPGSELLADDFNDGDAAGWTISPLGHERAGAWSTGFTLTTAVVTRNPTRAMVGWTDYSLKAELPADHAE